MTTRPKRGSARWQVAWLVLAACGAGPSPAPTIGPSGGTVTSADGRARLVVPPGALGAEVALTVEAAASVPLDPHALQGAAYLVSPAATAFAVPASLRIAYQAASGPSGTAEAEWGLRRLESGAWAAASLGAADPLTHLAEGPLATAGTYGVVWAGPSAACTEPADREFDFWLGRWTFTVAGAVAGTDDVTLEGQGCLVEEHFQDPRGGRGRSVSLRSRLDGRWHQTYLDSHGLRLVLVGERDGERMVLLQAPTLRHLWERTSPEAVRYWTERTLELGGAWEVRFDSTYTLR